MTPGRTFVALIAVAVIGACGDAGISSTASADLERRVAAVRAAAETGDRDEAASKLQGLQRALEIHVENGEVSKARAADILASVRTVEERLALLPAPSEDIDPTPPDAAEDEAAVEPARPDEDDEDDEDDDNDTKDTKDTKDKKDTGHGNEGEGNGDDD
jgi:hypothetical protein